jgi:hypothetical protein
MGIEIRPSDRCHAQLGSEKGLSACASLSALRYTWASSSPTEGSSSPSKW